MKARKPTKAAGEQMANDDLAEARGVLGKFIRGRSVAASTAYDTREAALRREETKHPLDPKVIADPWGYEARMLELTTCSQDIRETGCWLRRAMDRGAGVCTPAPWAGEGRHLLVLDAQAVAELLERLEIFDRDQHALRQLRRLRGNA